MDVLGDYFYADPMSAMRMWQGREYWYGRDYCQLRWRKQVPYDDWRQRLLGSNTQLIAPITVGAGATIATGTTLTSNAPDDPLTLQANHAFWLEAAGKKALSTRLRARPYAWLASALISPASA